MGILLGFSLGATIGYIIGIIKGGSLYRQRHWPSITTDDQFYESWRNY